MNFLAIETSGPSGSVAFGTEQSRLFPKDCTEKVFTRGMRHGKEIVLRISEILNEKKKTLRDVDVIAVDIGPGSYTGLRVGVMTAKTLAFCNNKKLFPVASLDILIENHPPAPAVAPTSACTLIDAKQGEVYFCLYVPENGKWRRISDYLILSPEEAVKKIPEGAAILGDGTVRIENLISSSRHEIISEKHWRISARNALLLAAERFAPETSPEAFSLEPLYLRRPMAEVLREKRRK